MFLTEAERDLSSEFLRQGYVVRPAADLQALDWMRSQFVRLAGDLLGHREALGAEATLNRIHEQVGVAE